MSRNEPQTCIPQETAPASGSARACRRGQEGAPPQGR